MSKADRLGVGSSFSSAQPISARRAATAAATEAPTEGAPEPTELPTKDISHNPRNPREELRDIDELAATISEVGLVAAITVARVSAYLEERPDEAHGLDPDTHYVVVDGHRRLEACRQAEVTPIKVRVDDSYVATDQKLLEAAFVANFHSDKMTDLEQAHALDTLVTFYGSQTEAARRLGISQANIASKLSLLRLTPELQADLVEGRRKVEHVRNLGKLSSDEQRATADTRAEKAAQRAQKRSPKPQASEETVDPYHGVISEEAGGTSPESPDEIPSPAPSPSATTPSSAATEQEDPRPSPEPQEVATAVPWHDVPSVAAMIKTHMTTAQQHELLAALSENRDKV